MAEEMRIVHPFAPHSPSNKELAYNATRWATVARGELKGTDIGFIFLFFRKDAIGSGRGITVSNVNVEAIKDELRSSLKKFNDRQIILTDE